MISNNPDKQVQLSEIERYTKSADAVVLQAPGHADAKALIDFYKMKGKKVIVDYDDYSFDLSPSNPRYADLGTVECSAADAQGNVLYKWKDGENGFDLQENLSKYNGFVDCVKAADLVTTTTEYLASKFRPLNPNVKILPNSIDFDLWKPVRRKPGRENQIRIGWFGGDSHFPDLWVFRDVITRIVKKYPQVVIVIQAPPVQFWKEMFAGIPPQNLEWYGWADLSLYTLFLASKDFDIGLCPLDPSIEFNKCKSSIKQFEFAAFKVPSVCQDMLPYSANVKDGVNGFLASTAEEWEDKLSRLIEDKQLRERMGEEAYQRVYSEHNLDKNAPLWEEAYLSVFDVAEDKDAGPSRCSSERSSAGCGA